MKHQINTESLLNGQDQQEFKSLLAMSSGDKKKLFAVLVIYKDGKSQSFFEVEGIWNTTHFNLESAIKDYNSR
jgi:hypothetical protein